VSAFQLPEDSPVFLDFTTNFIFPLFAKLLAFSCGLNVTSFFIENCFSFVIFAFSLIAFLCFLDSAFFLSFINLLAFILSFSA
jgi:hypothetical protein